MNIKKVKEWAKAHEVTLMMIGSAITGAAGFYIYDNFLFKKDIDRKANIVLRTYIKGDKVGIGISECLPNGEYGYSLLGLFSAKTAVDVAEDLIGRASDILNSNIKIEAFPSQKKQVV